MKISISKKEHANFDGKYISNGHWIIDVEILEPSMLTFNEPYETLIAKGLEFSKVDGEIIIGQKKLPIENLDVGTAPCSLLPLRYQFSSEVDAIGFLHWEDGELSGVIPVRWNYFKIIRQIVEVHNSTLLCTPGKHHKLITVMDGDKMVAGFMPLREDDNQLDDIIESASFLANVSVKNTGGE